MASHLSYLVKYAEHLYTLSGGTLRVDAWVKGLWGQQFYQVAVELKWNGKRYATSVRHDARSAVSQVSWGDHNHPLVYQLAVALRELCKELSSQGCDYALPPM